MQAAIAPHLDAFQSRDFASGEPGWLAARRRDSIERFAEGGFPSRDDEAWRFSDLRALTGRAIIPSALEAASSAALPDSLSSGGTTHRIVLIDGRFSPALSDLGELPPGVWLNSTSDTIKTNPVLAKAALAGDSAKEAPGFAHLNSALFSDGFILALESGVEPERPFEIVHFSTAAEMRAYHLRNAVVLGAGAKASLIETYTSAVEGWCNMVTRIDLDEGAVLRHVKVQSEAEAAFHIAQLEGGLARDASYHNFTAVLGARLSREAFALKLNGEGGRLGLNGIYLLHGEQEATFAPTVEHHAPNCRTDEIVKGVVGGRAHGVFLGTVAVEPGADGTDAHQLNRNLLLDPQARVDAKPELTIHADDVKCSHGATVGDLDESALFYLAARGIEPKVARRILTEAFVDDVLEASVLGPMLSQRARDAIADWFDRAGDRP